MTTEKQEFEITGVSLLLSHPTRDIPRSSLMAKPLLMEVLDRDYIPSAGIMGNI